MGNLPQQARYNLGAHHFDQPRSDRRRHHKKGTPLAIIDPIVGGSAQAQSLAGYIPLRQRRLLAVIDSHMPVDVQ